MLRSGMPPREPSFGGFGTGTSVPAVATSSLHTQGSFRQDAAAATRLVGPEASSASAPGQVYLPPPAPLQSNPMRHSTPGLHGSISMSARADAFQASVGAIGDVSALLHHQAMHTPGTGSSGMSAAALLARNGVGITGYIQSMQHAQAAFTVEVGVLLSAQCAWSLL